MITEANLVPPHETCQHDPLAVCCTLVIESDSFGSRIRCFVCDRCNEVSRTSGRFNRRGAEPQPEKP
jgi:hypothetical protein